MFLNPWSRSRLKKMPGTGAVWEKNQEPEPLEKKSGSGAAKKLSGSSALNVIIEEYSFLKMSYDGLYKLRNVDID